MKYGICPLTVVPLRAEPSDKSEMVSQLLFGEHYQVMLSQNNWLQIKCGYDEYEGWIAANQHCETSLQIYNELSASNSFLNFDLVQLLIKGKFMQTIVIGSTLPYFDGKNCYINQDKLTFEGNAKMPMQAEKSILVENAFMYLNSPYLWGGRSPLGIDCSGFTQMVYKLSGIRLKRDARLQAEQGKTINLLAESNPGDLVFFDNEEGNIVHVGILINKENIIHSSGQVRVDKIDHHGIYDAEQKKYSHKLRVIKRLI
ncbi:MAG TPA: C40 family peptidase [Bacteroidia bacterium]|nr:C40 family peptidase [Bacteroidia bacterium]HNT80287.1 C40 family peptidase [Bacteroidia bacterium]